MNYRVHVREQVKRFLESLAPAPKRRLKLAMKALEHERGDCLALREQLTGYHRLRVGGHRIIYRYLPGRAIECVFVEERSLIYQLFEREVLEKLRHEGPAGAADDERRVEEAEAKYRSQPRRRRGSISRGTKKV